MRNSLDIKLEEEKRKKFLKIALGILGSIGYIYTYIWNILDLNFIAVINFTVAVMCSIGFQFDKSNVKVDKAANFFIFVSIVYCFSCNIFIYRQFPILIGYYPLIPMVSLLLLNRRTTFKWIFITGFAMLLSAYLSPIYGYDINFSLSINHYVNLFQGISIFLILLTLLYFYNRNIVELFDILSNKNEQIEKSKIELEKTQTAKEVFFATISHEIRTPMNAIKGISELLVKTKQENDTNEELYLALENSSRHLLSLINDILDIGKIAEEKLILHNTDFDLKNLIISSVKMVEFIAKEKDIVCNYSFSDDFPTIVKGDSMRISQIVVNILSNAVKFTEKGSVVLEADLIKDEIDYFRIKIKDTGIGIADERKDNIFDRFNTSNFQTHSKHKGSGLGLNIAKSLIQLMNGKIWFESTKGVGTTFYLTFPLIKSNIKAIKNESLIGVENIHLNNLKILIVDDNLLNVMIAKKILENDIPNIEVHSSENGLKAIELVNNEKEPFSIILMDIQMPVMDGIEATKILKSEAKNKQIPIVAMTASGDMNEIQNGLNNGMIDYISKPFESVNLIKMIYKYTN